MKTEQDYGHEQLSDAPRGIVTLDDVRFFSGIPLNVTTPTKPSSPRPWSLSPFQAPFNRLQSLYSQNGHFQPFEAYFVNSHIDDVAAATSSADSCGVLDANDAMDKKYGSFG